MRGPSVRDLVTILYRPRETMRRILDSGHTRWSVEIVVLASLCAAIADPDLRRLRDLFPSLSLGSHLALAVLAVLAVSAFWVLALFCVAAVATFVGRRLFGGGGKTADVRAALAWGLVPVIGSAIFKIPIAIYAFRLDLRDVELGPVMFDFVEKGGCTVALFYATAQILVDVWVLFVASNTVAESHRFSSARGFGTVMISMALPILLIAGIAISSR